MSELLLRLYVSGNSPGSRRAQEDVVRLRDTLLPTGWEVKVVDVLAEPQLAEEASVIATPTLSYDHPTRPRRVIGDLSDIAKVLDFLGIRAKDDDA